MLAASSLRTQHTDGTEQRLEGRITCASPGQRLDPGLRAEGRLGSSATARVLGFTVHGRTQLTHKYAVHVHVMSGQGLG